MARLNQWLRRLWLLRSEEEREIRKELLFHLDRLTEEFRTQGMSRRQARRKALARFGKVGYIEQECVEANGFREEIYKGDGTMKGLLNDLGHDIRYGLRTLRKNPGFTAVAVLTLALGIGANTAIFSVVNGVLLQPLPYPDSSRLMMIGLRLRSGSSFSLSPAKFDFVQRENRSFEALGALNGMGAGYNLTEGAEAVRVTGYQITANYFEVLGVYPVLGRFFRPEEERSNAEPEVLLSHGLWQRAFGGDEAILDRPIRLSGKLYRVAGVMPKDLVVYPSADLWFPLPLQQTLGSGSHNYQVLGRPRESVTTAQAEADLSQLHEAFRREHADLVWETETGYSLDSYQNRIVGSARLPLTVLAAGVAFVLLIACANLASLLLARATTRSREMAIRTAMGASRSRLLRQMATESLLLASLGAAVGLVLAQGGLAMLVDLSPAGLPRLDNIQIDGGVLGFTLIVAVLAGLLSGLAPAGQLRRAEVYGALKESEGRTTGGISRLRLRKALVMGEVALSLILLIGAGLLMRTFFQLVSVDPGFNYCNVLTAQLSLAGDEYATSGQISSLYGRLLERMRALPGVREVAMVSSLPLDRALNLPISLEGWQDRMEAVEYRLITPDYFRVMEIPLLAGRLPGSGDREGSAPVVFVNQAFAERFFPGETPLGRRIRVQYIPDRMREIVGVVGNTREFSLDGPTPPAIYLSAAQAPSKALEVVLSFLPAHLVIRTEGDAAPLSDLVRHEVRLAASAIPVSNIRTMEQIHAASVARERFRMLLAGLFAGFACVLVAVGIYGVISYLVSQRTHEIGIRMALGARGLDVVRMVLGQGLGLVAGGGILGLAGAYGLTRYLESLLFGVSATDPLTFIGVPALVLAVGLLACYLPARRATQVDPMVALRYE